MKKIDADVLEGKAVQFAAIRPYDLLDAIEYKHPIMFYFPVKDTVVIIFSTAIVEFLLVCVCVCYTICFVNFLRVM